MLARLTVVTSLFAIFAVSFSLVVENADRSPAASSLVPSGKTCLERGLVCAPATVDASF